MISSYGRNCVNRCCCPFLYVLPLLILLMTYFMSQTPLLAVVALLCQLLLLRLLLFLLHSLIRLPTSFPTIICFLPAGLALYKIDSRDIGNRLLAKAGNISARGDIVGTILLNSAMARVGRIDW